MTDLSAPAPLPERGAPLPVRLTPPDFTVPARPAGSSATGLATASLVLGIVSLILNLLLLPTILAVVFGSIALSRGTVARARSVVGIVLGALGVIAIGVQAAIAIPVYLAVVHRATGESVQAALTNDRTALTGYAVDHGGRLPEQVDPAALAPYGWTSDASIAGLAYSVRSGGGADAFCLVAAARNGARFVVTTHTPVALAAGCPTGEW